MVKLLYGTDSYRRGARLREIVLERTKKGERTERIFLEKGEDVERALQLLRHVSLFGESSVMVVENLFEAGEKFSDLRLVLKDTIKYSNKEVVIIEESKPTKEWAFLTKKPVEIEEFSPLQGAEWMHFIKKEAERRGVVFVPTALKLLGSLYEGDSWRVVTFLEKAQFYSSGKPLTEEDVVEEGGTKEINLWYLLSDLRSPSLSKRFEVLEKIFFAQEPAAKIFHLAAARHKKELPFFARYDVAVKSGKIDYEEALLDLATR
ncbi:MAG: hypothetical protein KGZ30_04705 [Anaplasmataceae bacterium]|nr:hypothetical protein [Anaplasmataceae bacterium]